VCLRSGSTPIGDYTDANFEAIDSTVAAANYNGADGSYAGTMAIYALRHRVNGAFVGGTKIAPFVASDLLCSIQPDDVYEIDVWYKLSHVAGLSYPTTAGKFCVYFPTASVATGSRRFPLANVAGGFRPQITFSNVDFSKDFNYLTETYGIEIAGHSGWTLHAGANDMKMETSSPWAAFLSNGTASVIQSDPAYCKNITIAWNKEIPDILYQSGSLSASSQKYYRYRSTIANSSYRSNSSSTDYGTITHANPGRLNHLGVTVFELVPWATDPQIAVAADQVTEGYIGTTPPAKPADVPSTVTVWKVKK
jgi:hypothetical protein